MSKFEDRLWSDLVRRQSSTAGERAMTNHQGRAGRLRTAYLMVAGVTSVGAAVAASFMLGIGGATPAFAVAANSDGTVTVTLNELVGVGGANAQLEKLGVAVRVAKVEANCSAPIPSQTGANVKQASEAATISAQGTATVHPASIPAGDTIVLTAQEIEGHVSEGIAVVRGGAPSCLSSAQEVNGAPLQ
jgi:hypothetical protein